MSDAPSVANTNPNPLPPAPAPEPPVVWPHAPRPSASALPWWVPGLAAGLIAAFATVAVAVYGAAPAVRGTHKATARVEVRPAPGEAALPDAERQNVAFLIRSRDLLTRTLAVPEVAALAAVREWADPVAELERRVAVEVSEPGVVTVTLTGDHPDDLKVLLDNLVRRFRDDYSSIRRHTADERITGLEKTRAVLQLEIDLQEKAIELAARMNGTTGASDPSSTPARLRDRLNLLEAELAKDESAITLLEAQAEALKRRQVAGAAPDPVELARLTDADARVALLVAQRAEATVSVEKTKAATADPAAAPDSQANLERIEKALAAVRGTARKEADALLRAAEARRADRDLAELAIRLEVAKAAREFDRGQRDALRKVVESSQVAGLHIDSLRRSVVPQQEQANKITAQLIQLRVSGVSPASVREPATVEPARAARRWGELVVPAGAAFLAGFALVTAFQLTGLAFHALRRAA